jgi:hypothetical protein
VGGREAQVDHEALLEAKDETIQVMKEHLRLRAEEIHRRDVIISQLTQANAALAQRVPELEAPAGETASFQVHEDASGGPSRNGEGVGAPPTDRKPQNGFGAREPWYRRWWFGG